MQFRRFIQNLHRWLALALGVQLVFWFASGSIMSLLPLAHVKGQTAIAYSAPLDLRGRNYFPIAGVIAQFDDAKEATLTTWLGREVYIVRGEKSAAIFDADTGERLSPLSADDAQKVAVADFAGEDAVLRTVMMTVPPREAGKPGPLWRVEFADRDQTRLYVSPDTGQVVARRNRVWRFYDFFWMLHIMDYEERDNFNNPLVRVFAVSGFGFALTGLAMVLFRLFGGRYAEDVKRINKKTAE